ncbi:HAMP domain-containing sensor histidine kinase [Dielma fastidiosa]|uniref:HAMP domain-containing sensor histidine kinase n=1 Tax=Dielma fastidiosa TaxID=1034346 RepID=UPI000D799E09|nr:HAMP domain-containing sensor histidine kinase [Dielma fastidiosa]PWM55436.1 MAG: sensor histidine kinase [Dielma fastidiosa]
MLKKLSLRARLTLLSTLLTTSMAVLLTCFFMFNADRIFVKDLPIVFTAPDSDVALTFKAAEPSAAPVDSKTLDQESETDPSYNNIDIVVTLTQATRQFNLWGIAGLCLITLLGGAAAWLMAGKALKPVRELSSAIEKVSDNDLSLHVETTEREDEISQLGKSFNTMMDKVNSSFERQKRFSANAAHELKTPLATIQVGLDVLELDEKPTQEQMEWALTVTKANTERMIELVENLFTLSSDKECDMNDIIDIQDVFTRIVDELAVQIDSRHLQVTMQISDDIKLKGNAVMLYRALFNLVENAIKYNIENGTILITAIEEGAKIKVSVSDSGIGINDEDMQHIFEPFYRADQSRSRLMGGSGLGLSLVNDIIKKHDAEIDVDSQPNRGTVFTAMFKK